MAGDLTGDSAADWLSERAAARLLAPLGLSRRRAIRVLAAGLAGPSVRTSAATLYSGERVRALAEARTVDDLELRRIFPGGVFVARRVVTQDVPRETQLAELTTGWDISPVLAVRVSAALTRDGPIPFLATTGGFVTLGAARQAAARRFLAAQRPALGPRCAAPDCAAGDCDGTACDWG